MWGHVAARDGALSRRAVTCHADVSPTSRPLRGDESAKYLLRLALRRVNHSRNASALQAAGRIHRLCVMVSVCRDHRKTRYANGQQWPVHTQDTGHDPMIEQTKPVGVSTSEHSRERQQSIVPRKPKHTARLIHKQCP
ncbi:unnamed protein product, partial [Iphiclides podalirius]